MPWHTGWEILVYMFLSQGFAKFGLHTKAIHSIVVLKTGIFIHGGKKKITLVLRVNFTYPGPWAWEKKLHICQDEEKTHGGLI